MGTLIMKMGRKITMMIGFYRNFAEVFARGIRKTMGYLVFSGGLVLLVGCPSGGGATKPAPVVPTVTSPPLPPTPPTPGEGGGAGGSSEPKIIVGDSPLSVTLNENGPETLVTLPYKGQGGAIPTSCSVGLPLGVTVTKPCACTEGVCSVGVQPPPEFFGDGSFEFRLFGQSGQKEISSDIGKASVKVLEVTLSIHAGDNQGGTVGENLPGPIVVRVQNSNKEPISGVKIFWDMKKNKSWNEEWKKEWTGEISCTGETDSQGLAQCIWTLGTSTRAASREVNASAFYSFEKTYKETLGRTFSASAKPGDIAKLSFRSFDWVSLPVVGDVYAKYGGPRAIIDGSKPEKAGVSLGGGIAGELWVFAQDKHGNSTTVESDMDVTLSLKKNPTGASFIGISSPSAKMINLEQLDDSGYKWTQGIAKFFNVKVNKVGRYTLDASTHLALDTWFVSFFEFIVDPGDATKLVFTTQPRGGAAGVAWDSQPVVAIQDEFGNTVTATYAKNAPKKPIPNNAEIRLAIDTNAGITGVLSGSTGAATDLSLNANKGVATFSGLKINVKGDGYTLKASSGALFSDPSLPFNIR